MSELFLPYAKQSIQEEDRRYVEDALKGEIITRGKWVTAFEQAMATYCGARHAVAFNSGTSALAAAYFAANLSSFDRVVSTPNSFIATIGAPLQKGIYPQFVDINRDTGNLNLNELQETLDFRSTRGQLIIVPVHFSGIPVDMQALDRKARHPNFMVIEDAAHAIGSSYATGEKVGCCKWSQMTIFSFHPAKTLTTGEGGMVLTNDDALCHRLQLYRNNGIEREPSYLKRPDLASTSYYEAQTITGNFHLTDFQAALGVSQLGRLDEMVKKRRRLVKLYREKLKNIEGLTLFNQADDERTAFHLCVVQIDFKAYKTTRAIVMEQLKAKGIGTQVHYIPLYFHPVFKHQKDTPHPDFPEMETYYSQALSLPLYYDLTEEDVKRVCRELKKILKSPDKKTAKVKNQL